LIVPHRSVQGIGTQQRLFSRQKCPFGQSPQSTQPPHPSGISPHWSVEQVLTGQHVWSARQMFPAGQEPQSTGVPQPLSTTPQEFEKHLGNTQHV
jgi:hypothetical protein